MYYVPKRVIEEYRNVINGNKKITIPVIKRKLNAMIKSSKRQIEQLDKETFYVQFGNLCIYFEPKNHVISKIEYSIVRKTTISQANLYKRLCKQMGLNSEHTNFLV